MASIFHKTKATMYNLTALLELLTSTLKVQRTETQMPPTTHMVFKKKITEPHELILPKQKKN